MKVKGIMFYGFAAAILTGTAHAVPTPFTIASQAYVDEQVSSVSSGNTEAVNALAAKVGGNYDSTNTVAAAIAAEVLARESADTALDGRLDVLEGDASTAGSVAKAEADAKAYTDTQLQSYTNTTNMNSAISTAQAAAETAAESYADGKFATKVYVGDLPSGLPEGVDSVTEYVAHVASSVGGDTTSLGSRITNIENSDAYKSGIDATKVAQIQTNADAIAALDNTYAKDSDVSDALALKQDASKSTVANGTYAHITQGDGVAANLLSLNSALVNAESNITTINNSAVMNSGIDSTKVGQIATNTTNISNNATSISGLDTRTAILANKTCTAQSGRCVLSVDNNGNLAWVAVTDPAESNNE